MGEGKGKREEEEEGEGLGLPGSATSFGLGPEAALGLSSTPILILSCKSLS